MLKKLSGIWDKQFANSILDLPENAIETSKYSSLFRLPIQLLLLFTAFDVITETFRNFLISIPQSASPLKRLNSYEKKTMHSR